MRITTRASRATGRAIAFAVGSLTPPDSACASAIVLERRTQNQKRMKLHLVWRFNMP